MIHILSEKQNCNLIKKLTLVKNELCIYGVSNLLINYKIII